MLILCEKFLTITMATLIHVMHNKRNNINGAHYPEN